MCQNQNLYHLSNTYRAISVSTHCWEGKCILLKFLLKSISIPLRQTAEKIGKGSLTRCIDSRIKRETKGTVTETLQENIKCYSVAGKSERVRSNCFFFKIYLRSVSINKQSKEQATMYLK